jgi:hypothetical protein
MNKKYRKALICDPVCANPFGHNVIGLKYFIDKFRDFSYSVSGVCSKSLPTSDLAALGFYGGFDFVYSDFIKVERVPQFCRDLSRVTPSSSFVDAAEEIVTKDLENVLFEFDIGPQDAVVFPSVDLYGGLALTRILERIPPSSRPDVLLRFIGVMENAALGQGIGLDALIFRLKQLGLGDGRIRLSAETPAYARFLSCKFGVEVVAVPFPGHGNAVAPSSNKNVFNVSVPGSARFDKGYGELRELFTLIRQSDPDLRIRFFCQSLPPSEAVKHAEYTDSLYSIPGMTILPYSLSDSEMNSLYAYSDLILLPYDPAVYRMRGSAVLMEAINRARPVLALDGSAFCEEISIFGSGTVVSSLSEMALEVKRMAALPDPVSFSLRMVLRQYFEGHVNLMFQRWVLE